MDATQCILLLPQTVEFCGQCGGDSDGIGGAAGDVAFVIAVLLDHRVKWAQVPTVAPVGDHAAVPVLAGDTEETLHERIKDVERVLYPDTIKAILQRGSVL